MKKIILVLTSLLITLVGWTQNANNSPYAFTLNGKTIVPEANVQSVKQMRKLVKSKLSPQDNIDFVLVQFEKIPTLSEQQQLASQGLTLLNYAQGKAYFASVAPTFYSSESTSNLRSIIDIRPEYKIAQELSNKKSLPDYAIEKAGVAKVVITYFDKASSAQIESDLKNLNLVSTTNLNRFHQINASVPISDLKILASLKWVQNIELVDPPLKAENNHGKTSHRANVLNSTIQGLGYGLTGKGVKVGLWDLDVYNHRDFNGRVINREYEYHISDHGTHTCGTIAGAGLIDPKAIGMAPEALVYAWNFNTQSNGLNNAQERLLGLDNDGIEITSNSFGSSTTTCPQTIAYGTTDKNEDLITNWYPYFLFVYSAGNAQTNCLGGFYTTTKNMKNALMVAAIDQMDQMSWFSSFGPSKDGRLIPNISGDGVDTYSNFFDNGYGLMSGTSMATPGVAGTMALVYQRYKETHGGMQPISAFLRALACNTALDLGNPGPDYKYGYGAINGLKAVEVMEQNNYYVNSVTQGTNVTKNITVPAGAVGLKVMLAWTDAAGTPGAAKILVNDLDLKVTNNGTDYLPWILDPAKPNDIAVRGVDNMNNLEQVTLSNPAAGTYTITVNGTLIPQDAQEFAVVYEIDMPLLRITYPIGGEYIAPANQEVIRWDCDGYNGTFTLEYSVNDGVDYNVIAANISSTSRSYLWTVPSNINSAKAKIRISNGSVFAASKANFNVMSVPQNVRLSQAQCSGDGPFYLKWNAIPNAKYQVYKLNGQVYDLLAEVTDNSYTITGITQNNNNWFCVRAVDQATGAVSERSIAATVNPSLAVTTLPFNEKFESQKAANFYFTSVKGMVSVRYVNDAQKYGIRLEGTSGATTDWVAGTEAACFTNNPTYVVKAGICNIDASSMAGKKMALKFDYRQKYRTAAGTSYFRVKVNGNYLTNADGIQIYGATNTVSYKTVYYDLSSLAGNNSVNVEFEAVCKTNYTTYLDANGNYNYSLDTYDVGDFVAIDNLQIYEPLADLAITSYTFGTALTSNETISLKVKNLSADAVSGIPVWYQIGSGTKVEETIATTINPFTEVSYSFAQKADLSGAGKYDIVVAINYPDFDASNNSKSATKINNGTDLLMGIATGTKTTCSAVLTDRGGRYADYTVSQTNTLTIKPDVDGKNSKVTFTEFATELDYDYLYIYDGPTTSSPLLGTFTGNVIPPSFTSSATGGELTFKFTSDTYENDKGFIATIECVDKPAIDLVLTSVAATTGGTSSETVTIKVKNISSVALTDIPVWYQVGSGTVVNATIAGPVASYAEATYAFAQKADFSVGGLYLLNAGVEYTGDAVASNNTLSTNVISNGTDILMGVATGTITTCSAIFTDIGGRYADYPLDENSVITFKPDVAGKASKVTFTEFATEEGYDYLFVYDGPTTASPLLGSFTGATLPPSFTSSAIGGELTFEFYSDDLFNDMGFVANIECVTSNIVAATDAGISALSIVPRRNQLTTIKATIKNFGNTDISNFDVAYKINGGAEVIQTIAGPIVGGTTAVVTFTTPGDLTNISATNTVEVYTLLAGDGTSSNDKMTQVFAAASTTNVVGGFWGGTNAAKAETNNVNLTSNYTIEAWVNLSDPVNYGHIFNKTNVWLWYNTSYGTSFYGTNSFVLSVNKSSGSFTFYVPNSVKTGTWQHLALTVSAANVYTLYIDGVAQTWTVYSGTSGATKDNSANPICIGNRPTDLIRSPNGMIDEVRVWNSELSQATIQANMMTDYAANTAGMVAYYKFKEGTDKFVYDYSSNDNTAVISGANVTNTGASQFWNIPGNLLANFNITGQKYPTVFDPQTNTFTSVLDGVNLAGVVANFTKIQNSIIKVGTVTQTSGVTANNFTNPVTYTALGFGFNAGITQTYTMNVTNDLSSACELTSYSFQTADNAALTSPIVLTKNGSNFAAKVTSGANVSALKAQFTASTNAKVYFNGVLQTSPQAASVDYSHPLMVTVLAENGRLFKNFTITLDTRSNLADLTSFSVNNEQVGTTTIDQNAHTILIYTKNNSDLSDLASSFTVSPKASVFVNSITQINGITVNNFTSPVIYTVVSEDQSTSVNWTVTAMQDLTKPVITLNGAASVNVYAGSAYNESGATASDDIDGNITNKIVIDESAVNTSAAGSYTVNYSVTDMAGNTAQATRTVVVIDKLNQTITFADVTKTYGDADFSPATTDATGLTVTYSSDNTAVATFLSGKIHIVGSGVANITASQAGNAVYNAATSVTKVLTVGKKAQTISLSPVMVANYMVADVAVNATATSGLPVTLTIDNPNVATIVNGKIHFVGGGTAILTATQAGDNNYAAAPSVSKMIAVGRFTQTIAFQQLPTKRVGDKDMDPGATTTSGLAIAYTSSNTSVATIVEGKIRFLKAGTTDITASQSGNANIFPADAVTRTLTVDFATAISETTDNAVKIYPNPSKGKFVIELPSDMASSASMIVRDVTGRNVMTIEHCQTLNDVNLENQSKGFYFMTIRANGTDKTYKLIVE